MPAPPSSCPVTTKIMKYRKLGKSGLDVSEVGFGAWGIGGAIDGDLSYGATDDAQSCAALRAAFDSGITFYDTAPAYGDGHSEALIAKALGAHRADIVIATKGGMERFGQPADYSVEALILGLEGSLRRLGTDYIDFFQLHNPPADLLVDARHVRDLIEAWKGAGKIRAFGISVKSPQEAMSAMDQFDLAAIQVNFNLVDQRCLELDLFGKAISKGVSIIARTPLCFGFLTGAYSRDTDFLAGDHRNRWPDEQIDAWTGALGTFRDVLARHPESSPAQFALRYCLSYDAVAATIPGMLTTGHVVDNRGASDQGPLPVADLAVIEDLYKTTSFFVRPGAEKG